MFAWTWTWTPDRGGRLGRRLGLQQGLDLTNPARKCGGVITLAAALHALATSGRHDAPLATVKTVGAGGVSISIAYNGMILAKLGTGFCRVVHERA
jgi:hypothetical protein